jgi:hypothetical protein
MIKKDVKDASREEKKCCPKIRGFAESVETSQVLLFRRDV